MRKVFHYLKALTIFLILALGLCPFNLALAQGSTVVSVSGPEEVNPGEQFTVEILVEPETAIAGVQFDLAFDSLLVTVNSVAEGNLLSQGGATTYFSEGAIDNIAGTISGVAGAITTPGQTVSTAGTFALITLTAGTQGGISPLTLSSVVVGDINGQSVQLSVVSGQVAINQAPSSGRGSGGGGSVPSQDEKAPELSDAVVSEITASSVYITWTTDEESTGQVEYWASPSNFSPLDETPVTYHEVHLTNLTSGTTYHYRVMSIDEADNLAISSEYTFATLGTPATFSVSALDITPTEASIGEEVTISLIVANSGDTAESYIVTLTVSLDGSTETTEQIMYLDGGASQEVTFTTVGDVAGTFIVDVNGISGSFIVKERPVVEEAPTVQEAPMVEAAPEPGPEIVLLRVTPSYDTETGKLVFARVTYQVSNLDESMVDAELTLKVSLDGETLEEVPLLSSNHIDQDGTNGSREYIPLQGWQSGTYAFQAKLYVAGEFLENTTEERLEVTPESIVKVVSWATLGLLIGSSLIVILIMLGIVLYWRRNMLRNNGDCN